MKPSLDDRDFVLFMKRLRKKYGEGIRFFHCGEYGEKLGRAHHHACLFNFDFPDKILWSVRENVKLYTSESLHSDEKKPCLWPHGYCTIGDVNFESAAYVARYVTKKITGENAESHYQGRKPEYITMSRRPGIGREWFDKFKSDVYPGDKLVIREDLICHPPRYYDNIYESENPGEMDEIKMKRRQLAKMMDDDYAVLERREKCKIKKAEKLIRPIEMGVL